MKCDTCIYNGCGFDNKLCKEYELDLQFAYLIGKWKVKVTSGPWWFMALNILKNKKIIKTGYEGHNLILGKKWGDFDIKLVPPGKCSELIILAYRDYPIVDSLVRINNDMLKGQFYYDTKFIGNFYMQKIKGGENRWQRKKNTREYRFT